MASQMLRFCLYQFAPIPQNQLCRSIAPGLPAPVSALGSQTPTHRLPELTFGQFPTLQMSSYFFKICAKVTIIYRPFAAFMLWYCCNPTPDYLLNIVASHSCTFSA